MRDKTEFSQGAVVQGMLSIDESSVRAGKSIYAGDDGFIWNIDRAAPSVDWTILIAEGIGFELVHGIDEHS